MVMQARIGRYLNYDYILYGRCLNLGADSK